VTHSHKSCTGNTALVTGAGGCIGAALVKRILACESGATVVLLDHSEQNLYEIDAEVRAHNSSSRHVAILGDICDEPLLDELLAKHHPGIIYHAAAFKHVPLMETNPIAVVRNNVLGTFALASAALRHRIPQLLMISTDKAVNPRSVMGAAKRVAELILLRLAIPSSRMTALRLGNVLGSHGSVAPLFRQQIARGGPITVTHPDARRYFLSLDNTVDLILAAADFTDPEVPSAILVPELAAPVKIVDLARRLFRETNLASSEIDITFTGLRPGDKLTEELFSQDETLEPIGDPRLYKITSAYSSPFVIDAALRAISESVHSRNLSKLLDSLCSIVADYRPSEVLLSLVNAPSAASASG
jgi:FlaA1/EpsC-like NDP-sugar epimerase